ncbi:MAG TPA: hypothetical protein GX523_07460 [Desulfitobacterium dehalogenans]|uniref:Uncharacterized protein n=1 Tax=Desulfitobacterium dehalogenans TaxID=36854 RepID=A0A7C7D596_9FIRM|nr:hypothetical protein [Desulfitobacterium dehalogenans]
MNEYTQAEIGHKTNIEILNILPEKVNAGEDLLIQVRVTSVSNNDLLGCKIQVIDFSSNNVTETELNFFNRIDNDTYEFPLKAPKEPGEYAWTVLFPAQQKEGTLFKESSMQFSFIVKPHMITISSWGVLSPVTQGEKFKVNIGVKCSAGCSLAGLPLFVMDDNHQQVAVGHLREEIMPQTNGFYWTEQELTAPTDEAFHKWAIQCRAQELEIQHQSLPETFLFRTAKPPEHKIMIKVINKFDKSPIQEAYVMLGLYKATADKNGVATLVVPGGNQELYITKDDYISFQTSLEISEDTDIKAELEYCPVL